MTLTNDEVSFLRGLIAGEGSFMVSLRKSASYVCGVQILPSFSMAMVEDADILHILQQKTGLGAVSMLRHKNPRHRDAERWRVASNSDIRKLIGLLGRPIHNPVEFLLGLIAGEGSFTVGLRKEASCVCGVHALPSFSMKMVEDADILHILQQTTGLGAVSMLRRKNPRHRDAEQWQVASNSDIRTLINMIEAQEGSLFWETDKGATFKQWKQAITLKEQTDTGDPEQVKRLIRIGKELNHGDRGRSAEDWCQIVDESIEARQAAV